MAALGDLSDRWRGTGWEWYRRSLWGLEGSLTPRALDDAINIFLIRELEAGETSGRVLGFRHGPVTYLSDVSL